MKKIHELELGFSDAENYQQRANKDLFSRIFVKNYSLDKLLYPSTNFLIGEKGTGKTAYSVFLANNYYKQTVAQLRYIRETEYQKFVMMKKEKSLALSDFPSVWKVIILLLLAKDISPEELDANPFSKSSKMKALWAAIDDYYAKAFSPEIMYALRFVDDSKLSAELISKYAKIGGEDSSTVEISEKRFQVHLLYIQKKFEEAIKGLKLKDNRILFIDGIDIRPDGIPYDDYLSCIKGLAEAAWSLNNDFFSNIKDSTGRFRVVLLLRPDIFNSLGLQNSINKLKDNSVYLDWRTTYHTYRDSNLFAVSDKILSVQQDRELQHGEAWDHYFQWAAPDMLYEVEPQSSFVSFLRYTYSRPRDVLSAVQIMQEIILERGVKGKAYFTERDFMDNEFKNRFSEYLMAGVKDQLAFYYDSADYEAFISFFNYLDGKKEFSYNDYSIAYEQFTDYIINNLADIPQFAESKEKFLQFLYDTNIICFIDEGEREQFVRWCYRERKLSNISPKVKLNSFYRIHTGLEKALNVGYQRIRSR